MKKQVVVVSALMGLTLVVLSIFAVSLFLQPSNRVNWIRDCVGKEVKIQITPVRKLSDRDQFTFFVMTCIPIGDVRTLVLIPVHNHYNIYETREGIIVAVEKQKTLSLYETISVIGEIKEDARISGNYVLFIKQIPEGGE